MEKYTATMALHALGDMMGFINGKWKAKYTIPFDSYKRKMVHFNSDLIIELISDFIFNGGITDIKINELSISEKTFYHIIIANTLITDESDNIDDLVENIKKNLFFTFTNAVKKIYKNLHLEIDKEYKLMIKPEQASQIRNTNGAAARNLCIGLYYNGKKNREKLIKLSILSSKITHNSPISYLSGFTTALFTAYAIENVQIEKWPFKLVKLLESEYIKNYIEQKNEDDMYDYLLYIKYWKTFIETRFKNKKILNLPIFYHLYTRLSYFNEHFLSPQNSDYLGETGISAVIMAYDAVISCNKNWERLVYYSILHIGDANAIGAIAGGLYGALYGFDNVPKYLIDDNLRNKYNLFYLGEQLFNKTTL
jgi:ADP-ribosylglycohydrolase